MPFFGNVCQFEIFTMSAITNSFSGTVAQMWWVNSIQRFSLFCNLNFRHVPWRSNFFEIVSTDLKMVRHRTREYRPWAFNLKLCSVVVIIIIIQWRNWVGIWRVPCRMPPITYSLLWEEYSCANCPISVSRYSLFDKTCVRIGKPRNNFKHIMIREKHENVGHWNTECAELSKISKRFTRSFPMYLDLNPESVWKCYAGSYAGAKIIWITDFQRHSDRYEWLNCLHILIISHPN